jgi:glycosyltransferase involved in cell wall biosynthesis
MDQQHIRGIPERGPMTRQAPCPGVLQVVLSLNPGGTERLVIEIVKRLRDETPMAVCCLDEKGAWAAELERSGIAVTALNRSRGFHPRLGRLVAGAARKHGATVVHCHHYSPFVYGCLAKLWRPRLRVIFTEHGRLSDAGPSPKRRLANSVLARAPEAVFAVSENLKEHIVAEGFPGAAVGVIYNGIEPGTLPDLDARRVIRARLQAAEHDVIIGTVARLDPVKDLGTLLRATAETIRGGLNTKLVIVGDGEERESLRRLCAELAIDERVVFLGQREDARDWLAGVDLYVNSSISEGISLTILEAMAAGLPVIATGVGGTPEVVDSTCGRLVPARNVEAMSLSIAELGNAPAIRRTLGHAARRRLETRFSIDRMVREYLDVYRRVA